MRKKSDTMKTNVASAATFGKGSRSVNDRENMSSAHRSTGRVNRSERPTPRRLDACLELSAIEQPPANGNAANVGVIGGDDDHRHLRHRSQLGETPRGASGQ